MTGTETWRAKDPYNCNTDLSVINLLQAMNIKITSQIYVNRKASSAHL